MTAFIGRDGAVVTNNSRDQMIWSTVELLRRRGYSGTAWRDVVQHSGVSRGSIYHHFPGGKTQLTKEALQRGGELLNEVFSDSFTEHGPVRGLRRFVDLWASFLETNDFHEGCTVAAVAIEEHPDTPELAAAADAQFTRWIATIGEALRKHGISRRRSERVAATVVAALEGATLLCRARRSTEPLKEVGRELEETMRAAVAR